MSGAAGLSAAKRRRGSQGGTHPNQGNQRIAPDMQEQPPMHPLVTLQVHESKLDGLLTHITALGTAFQAHQGEVSVAIPQLQEAVEELLKNANAHAGMETIAEENPNNEKFDALLAAQEELSRTVTERLSAESQAKLLLEGRIVQIAEEHKKTEKRLVEAERNVGKLQKELAESKKRASKPNKDPTFPAKTDADIVKAALSKTDDNVTLETTEKDN